MLRKYTLTARLGKKVNKKTIEARNDYFAAVYGTDFILDKAHANQSSNWALGEIVLTNDKGEILQTMEAKA